MLSLVGLSAALALTPGCAEKSQLFCTATEQCEVGLPVCDLEGVCAASDYIGNTCILHACWDAGLAPADAATDAGPAVADAASPVDASVGSDASVGPPDAQPGPPDAQPGPPDAHPGPADAYPGPADAYPG